MIRRTLLALSASLLLAGFAAAQTLPKTVIHVISVKWKDGATKDQINAALRGAEALPSHYPGILHVWTRPIKKQVPEGYNHVIVMEFASEDALAKYADNAAQKKWYEAYQAVREESRTSDVTN